MSKGPTGWDDNAVAVWVEAGDDGIMVWKRFGREARVREVRGNALRCETGENWRFETRVVVGTKAIETD